MSNDLRVFRELVLWLWQTHEKPWEYHNYDARQIVENRDLLNYSVSDASELEKYLPTENNVKTSFPHNRFFYLNPIIDSRVMVPRIQLDCDFGRSIPEIRCRLGLFLFDDNDIIQSLGYRFESPEGKSIQGTGVHHYYHIQLIQPPMAKIEWLPETQPAFPIDADDPIKLILGLLISLYGLDYLRTILKEADYVWELKKYIDDVPYTKFGEFVWYRHIGIGTPLKYTDGYKITSNLNDFDTYIRGKYPGCDIKGITSHAFDALKGKFRKTYP